MTERAASGPVHDFLHAASRPAHLPRTGLIALVVGTWLTAFNHGDALVAGAWSMALGGKIILNYLTPFVVANLGLMAGKPGAATRLPRS